MGGDSWCGGRGSTFAPLRPDFADAIDSAVPQPHDFPGAFGDVVLVCHHHDGPPGTVEGIEQVHDLMAGGGVAKTVDAFQSGVYRGIKPDGVIGTI